VTTAAVAARRDGDIFQLVSHRIWKPTGDGEIGLRQTFLPWLVDLRCRYSLDRIMYDPYNLSTLAQMGREAGPRMEELPNATGNQTAFTGVLLNQIRSRGLRVYQAPDLREHTLNAVLVETAREIRLAKEKSSKKIDGAVALARALWSAQQHSYGDWHLGLTLGPWRGHLLLDAGADPSVSAHSQTLEQMLLRPLHWPPHVFLGWFSPYEQGQMESG